MLFVLIAYAALTAVYISFENKRNFKAATALKAVLSCFFTAVAVVAMVVDGFYTMRLVIAVGLGFSIFGDYYLQYIKRDIPRFKKGISFFTVTQALYIAFFIFTTGASWVTLAFFAAFIALALILMKVQNWDITPVKYNLSAYTLLIAFMAALAAGALTQGTGFGMTLICTGGIAFFASDMILGVWNFKTSKMYIADLNWIFYFAGQILIACGSFYMFV